MHTHDTTGQVWLEGRSIDQITLGQFFTVWGVRFDSGCLGAACDQVRVTADGEPVADGAALKLAEVNSDAAARITQSTLSPTRVQRRSCECPRSECPAGGRLAQSVP